MNKADKDARFDALRAVGCLCCRINLEIGLSEAYPQIEIHHLNGGGHHGQKRRGDEFTIPLCSWHHRGQGPTKEYTAKFGPSWAKGSKPFRAVYGGDDELLAMANRLIDSEAVDPDVLDYITNATNGMGSES